MCESYIKKIKKKNSKLQVTFSSFKILNNQNISINTIISAIKQLNTNKIRIKQLTPFNANIPINCPQLITIDKKQKNFIPKIMRNMSRSN